MAGLIPPFVAGQIIHGLKNELSIPIVLHTHETAGLGAPTYLAGIDAGVDSIDTSIVPFANGTGQPDTMRMLSLLQGHPRCPSYDTATLAKLRSHFETVYEELSDFTNVRNERVDTDALTYQVPGGMLSNFRNQLKEQKMEDRFEEVFSEIPVVRKALGWIPLVTPTSQIVGVQAMLNVKFGRWKNFSPQAMQIALGYYGRTPAPVDPEVRELAAKNTGQDPIECRPADLQSPNMDNLRKELADKGYPTDDEHCVIHAMFPQELDKYFEAKNAPPPAPPPPVEPAPPAAPPAEPAPIPPGGRRFMLVINGERQEVLVEDVR
jgi:oxaloacetate decarboxylase alpha subunit/pyruvate carboxylase subunit B